MPPPEDGLGQARAALELERERLAAARRRTPEIRALGQLLRELRSENHFAERVAEMLAPPPREGNGGSHGR